MSKHDKASERVLLATMNGSPARIGESGVWRIPCHSDNGSRPLVVKLLTLRKLLIELLCAVAGRRLGLPIPRPYLVILEPESLAPNIPMAQTLAFGSEEEPYPAVSSLIRDPARVELLLRRWERAKEAAAFDTWIANEDRTTKNLLLGQHLWLIDHDDAIPDWASANSDTANKILEAISEGLSEFDRHKLIRDVRNATAAYSMLDLDDIKLPLPLSVFERGPEQMKLLSDFLKDRISSVLALISARVNPRQAELLDDNRNTPTPKSRADTTPTGI